MVFAHTTERWWERFSGVARTLGYLGLSLDSEFDGLIPLRVSYCLVIYLSSCHFLICADTICAISRIKSFPVESGEQGILLGINRRPRYQAKMPSFYKRLQVLLFVSKLSK